MIECDMLGCKNNLRGECGLKKVKLELYGKSPLGFVLLTCSDFKMKHANEMIEELR